jgi:hypothetical protein
VTLLANRVPQRRLEGIRVDDRHVLAVDLCRTPNVQLARPVAPFAADGIAPEDRLLVPVDRTRHRLELVGVAEQALRRYGPGEVQVPLLIAGGQVPPLRAGTN